MRRLSLFLSLIVLCAGCWRADSHKTIPPAPAPIIKTEPAPPPPKPEPPPPPPVPKDLFVIIFEEAEKRTPEQAIIQEWAVQSLSPACKIYDVHVLEGEKLPPGLAELKPLVTQKSLPLVIITGIVGETPRKVLSVGEEPKTVEQFKAVLGQFGKVVK